MELLVFAADFCILVLVLVAAAAVATLAGMALAVVIKATGPPS